MTKKHKVQGVKISLQELNNNIVAKKWCNGFILGMITLGELKVKLKTLLECQEEVKE